MNNFYVLAGMQVVHTAIIAISRHSSKSGQKLFWQSGRSIDYGILVNLA